MSTPLSGYATTLPTNILLGPPVLYLDGNTAWGVSKGGIALNLPKEYENTDFDGKMLPIVGLDRRMGGIPSFEGQFVEMTTARMLELEPAGASSASGGITTVAPGTLGNFLVAADYKENVRLVWRLGGASAGIFLVEFDWGLLMMDKLTDEKNPVYNVKFELRQAANAASMGTPGYSLKMAADLATIVTADP